MFPGGCIQKIPLNSFQDTCINKNYLPLKPISGPFWTGIFASIPHSIPPPPPNNSFPLHVSPTGYRKRKPRSAFWELCIPLRGQQPQLHVQSAAPTSTTCRGQLFLIGLIRIHCVASAACHSPLFLHSIFTASHDPPCYYPCVQPPLIDRTCVFPLSRVDVVPSFLFLVLQSLAFILRY